MEYEEEHRTGIIYHRPRESDCTLGKIYHSHPVDGNQKDFIIFIINILNSHCNFKDLTLSYVSSRLT